MKKLIIGLLFLSSCRGFPDNSCKFRTTEAYNTISTTTQNISRDYKIVTTTKNDSVTKTILIIDLDCGYRKGNTIIWNGEKRTLIEEL